MNPAIDSSEHEAVERFCQYMEAHPEEAPSIRYILRRIFGPEPEAVLVTVCEQQPKIQSKEIQHTY